MNRIPEYFRHKVKLFLRALLGLTVNLERLSKRDPRDDIVIVLASAVFCFLKFFAIM